MKLFSQYKGLRKELYVLFISRIITAMGSMVWSMLTIILSEKLGLSAGEIANWFIFFMLGCIPMQWLGGKLADRFNKKWILIISDAIEVVVYFYCALSKLSKTSIIILLAGSCLENMSGPAYDGLLADLSSTEDRDRANSLMYMGVNIGMVFTPLISGFLVINHVNAIFYVQAICTAVALVIEMIFMRDVTPCATEADSYEAPKSSEKLLSVLKSIWPVLCFMVLSALVGLVYAQYYSILPLEMTRIFGEIGSVVYGSYSTINCLTVIAFTALITKWTEKMTDFSKYVISLVLYVAGFVAVAVFTRSIVICGIALVVFTIGEIFGAISCMPFITKRIPLTHRGRMSSYYGIAYLVITNVGQKPIAYLYDNYGPSATWISVFALAGVTLLGLGLLYFADRKKFPKLYEKGCEEAEE